VRAVRWPVRHPHCYCGVPPPTSVTWVGRDWCRQWGRGREVARASPTLLLRWEVMEGEGEGAPRRARADEGHDDVLEAGGGEDEADRSDEGERRRRRSEDISGSKR